MAQPPILLHIIFVLIPHHRYLKSRRGFAMVICLFVTAMLAGLTAAALRMSESDIVASRNYRSASLELAAAEAGIAHAVQLMNEGRGIDLQNDLRNWVLKLQAMQQKTSYNYKVTCEPVGADRGVLTATGSGRDNSLRTVQAFVIKSDIANAAPGAIYLAADGICDATFSGNNFGVNGNDVNFTSGLPGAAGAVPGITTRTENNAQESRDSLGGAQKDNVQGLGYIPGPPTTPSVSAVNGRSAA